MFSLNNNLSFSERLLCFTHIFISLIATAGTTTSSLHEHLFSAAGRKEVPDGYTGPPRSFQDMRKNGQFGFNVVFTLGRTSKGLVREGGDTKYRMQASKQEVKN